MSFDLTRHLEIVIKKGRERKKTLFSAELAYSYGYVAYLNNMIKYQFFEECHAKDSTVFLYQDNYEESCEMTKIFSVNISLAYKNGKNFRRSTIFRKSENYVYVYIVL